MAQNKGGWGQKKNKKYIFSNFVQLSFCFWCKKWISIFLQLSFIFSITKKNITRL